MGRQSLTGDEVRRSLEAIPEIGDGRRPDRASSIASTSPAGQRSTAVKIETAKIDVRAVIEVDGEEREARVTDATLGFHGGDVDETPTLATER
jgi:hypothetical protein